MRMNGLRGRCGAASLTALLLSCASSSNWESQPPDAGHGDDSSPAGGDGGGPDARESGGFPQDGSEPKGDSSAGTPESGTMPPSDGGVTDTGPVPGDGGCPTGAAAQVAPAGFWDASNLPPARNAVMFKFLNRTNGKFQDTELYWASTGGGADGSVHSFADAPTYDAPAISAGRLYVYLCSQQDPSNYAQCSSNPTGSQYFDWIEHNISSNPGVWYGNTTRVDSFGLKLAFQVQYANGTSDTRGEDYGLFCEDRAATFQRFVDEVPVEFQSLAQAPFAPYKIPEPGQGSLGQGGANANYYESWAQQIWSANGITIPLPGPDVTGAALNSLPDLVAAVHRHTGGTAGSFHSDGTTATGATICDDTKFYQAAPTDYYSKFWHGHAIVHKQYGFNYDDSCNTESSYVVATSPKVILIAVGW
jgi:hypothetical protein